MTRTKTMTLSDIRRWARNTARRCMRRDGFTLLPSYLVNKVKELALWTDGWYFELPEFWRVSMYRFTR